MSDAGFDERRQSRGRRASDDVFTVKEVFMEVVGRQIMPAISDLQRELRELREHGTMQAEQLAREFKHHEVQNEAAIQQLRVEVDALQRWRVRISAYIAVLTGLLLILLEGARAFHDLFK